MPYNKYFTCRFGSDMIYQMELRAKRENRTVSQLIRLAVENQYGKKDDPTILTPVGINEKRTCSPWIYFENLMKSKGLAWGRLVDRIAQQGHPHENVRIMLDRFYNAWKDKEERHKLDVNAELYEFFT